MKAMEKEVEKVVLAFGKKARFLFCGENKHERVAR